MENSERIQSHTVRIENSVKKLMVDNSDTNSALNKQNVAVSDLEKLFQGLPVDTFEDVSEEVTEQNEYVEEIATVLEGQDIGVVDVSDTTATANDVATGKKFYNANGELTEGQGSISSLRVHVDTLPPEYCDTHMQSNKYFTANDDGYVVVACQKKPTYLYDKEKLQWIKIYDNADFLGAGALKPRINSNGDIVIFDRNTKNMTIFDNKTKTYKSMSYVGLTNYDYPPSDVLYANEEYIYIIMSNTLYKFNKQTLEYVKINDPGRSMSTNISAPMLYKDRYIFVFYSMSGGADMSVLDLEKDIIYAPLNNIITMRPSYVVYIKEFDIIMLSTQNTSDGLNIYDPEEHKFIRAIENCCGISSYFITSKNELFVFGNYSTASSYLFKYNKDNKTFEKMCTQDIMYSGSSYLYEDTEGRIWYKYYNKGLYLLDENIKDLVLIEGSNESNVSSKLVETKNYMCYSNSTKGLYLVNKKTLVRTLVIEAALSSYEFNAMDTKNYGIVFSWQNSSGKGLYLINNDTLEVKQISTSDYDYSVYDNIDYLIYVPNQTRSVYKYDGTVSSTTSMYTTFLYTKTKFNRFGDLLFLSDRDNKMYNLVVLNIPEFKIVYISPSRFKNPHIYLDNDKIVVRNNFPDVLTYFSLDGKTIEYGDKYDFGDVDMTTGKVNKAYNGYVLYICKNSDCKTFYGNFDINKSRSIVTPTEFENRIVLILNEEVTNGQ